MTETLSHIALRRLNGEEATQWYTPFESVHVSLNQEGCLVIDAPLICDHILVTNDCAELSPDGRRFRILGRKDNVIDSGGIKIQIEEVEQMLKPFLRVPYMITKCSDVKFGEVVVLLTEDTEMSDVQEICMNALPKYWQPRRYFHIDHLPMTITHKPARAKAQEVATSCETARLGKK
jgi:O-succinylbenzoic acid--CoA ligase